MSETTSRTSHGGVNSSGSLGARGTRANSISLPPDPYELSGRALLKRGYVAQALIDSTAVLLCFLFILSFALSIPLSLFLLLFAELH